jgi:formate/nitrite transporter
MSIKSPLEIAKAIENVGSVKCGLSFLKMFILAIFAGIFIGFGAILATTVTTGISTTVGFGVSKFLGGAVFSVGLMLVVLCGAELFTGNNLIAVALCSKKVNILQVLKSWIVVYIGNFVGSIALAAIYFGTNLWGTSGSISAIGSTAVSIAAGKCTLDFMAALCRAILCNVLVCLAVWMSVSSVSAGGKILAIFFPIMAFVASGFEHSIANMYFIPIGLFIAAADPAVAAANTGLTWGGFVNNLVPVTIGNMIGGVIIVGILYWLVYLKPSKNAECKDDAPAKK